MQNLITNSTTQTIKYKIFFNDESAIPEETKWMTLPLSHTADIGPYFQKYPNAEIVLPLQYISGGIVVGNKNDVGTEVVSSNDPFWDNVPVLNNASDANSQMLAPVPAKGLIPSKEKKEREFAQPVVINGDKHWRLNGERHREYGPAIEYANGGEEWFYHGQRHRIGGPALSIPQVGGTLEQWWRYGKLHRMDGPAVKRGNGKLEWWIFGQLHREGAPAIEYVDPKNGYCSYKEWWEFGNRHRLDGPSIEYADGREEWHMNGEKVYKYAYPHK